MGATASAAAPVALPVAVPVSVARLTPARAVEAWSRRVLGSLGPLGTAVLCSATLLGLTLLLATPAYGTNDDVVFLMIASGGLTGDPSPYLVFPNVLIGECLRFLYAWHPQVNWYSCFLLALHGLGSTALLYGFLRSATTRTALLCPLAFLVCFQLPAIVLLQWTSAASFACLAGAVLILAGERPSPLALASGCCLIVVGAMTRHHAAYMVLLLLSPATLLRFRLRAPALPLLALAVALLLAVSLRTHDRRSYEASPEWKEYLEYNATRSRLHDGPLLEDTERAKRACRQVGLNWNDVFLFQNWFFADSEVFSEERLEGVVERLGQARRSPLQAFELLGGCAAAGVSQVLAMACLWVWIHHRLSSRRRLFHGLAGASCLLLIGLAFLLATRVKLPERVFSSMLLAQAGCLLLVGQRLGALGHPGAAAPLRPRHLAVLAFLCGAAIALTSRELVASSYRNARKQALFADLVGMLSRLQERDASAGQTSVFIIPGAELFYEWLPPLRDHRALNRLQILPLGWLTFSPLQQHQLRRYAIENPFLAPHTRPCTYVVMSDDVSKAYERFVLGHYGVSAQLETVGRIASADLLTAAGHP